MRNIQDGKRAYCALFKIQKEGNKYETCGWGSRFQEDFVTLHAESLMLLEEEKKPKPEKM